MSVIDFANVISAYLPEPHASLLNGIIFGIPLKTGKLFYTQVKNVGLLHIVVLSGTNITLLSSIIALLSSSFKKRTSLLFTVFVIVSFVLFVGPKPPIVRAAIMGILSSMAIIFGRRNSSLYALFLSLFLIALLSPSWLETISLQLSYAATIGIIVFSGIKNKSYFEGEVKTSLAAQIFTAPLLLFHFKTISLVAPLSNLLVSPVIAPLMIFGFATAILGKINFYLGLVPSYICFGLLSWIIWVIETLAQLPFSSIKI